jgi:hypothetical protein
MAAGTRISQHGGIHCRFSVGNNNMHTSGFVLAALKNLYFTVVQI